MSNIARVTPGDLEKVFQNATKSPRLRSLLILHEDNHIGPQAVLSCILPSSYVQPHKHPLSPELWFYFGGEGMMLPEFDEQGNMFRSLVLDRQNPFYEIPRDTYHGAIVLGSEPMFSFHVSQGPHDKDKSAIRAAWAPTDQQFINGEVSAQAYFAKIRSEAENFK